MMKQLLYFVRKISLGILLLFSLRGNATWCPSITSFTYAGSVFSACPCTTPFFGVDLDSLSTGDTLYATWNYGDGVIDTTFNVASTHISGGHAYTTAGYYTIWVKVFGPGSCIDSASISLDVTCHLITDTCPTIPWFTHIVTPVSASPCPYLEFNTVPCGLDSGETQVLVWDFGDGFIKTDSVASYATNYQYGASGTFTATVTMYGPGSCVVSRTLQVITECGPPPCYDCISTFAPEPGKRYMVSAWVREDSPAQSKTQYTYPSISILFPSVTDSVGPFTPSGNIIDGWQRIEGSFTVPTLATDFKIRLTCSSGDDCYFDDIRVQPFNSSMKSFVYDPVSLRLVAELDERNYATIYEYDEEGKLIRIKKETEKGIMSIKEHRNNTQKN